MEEDIDIYGDLPSFENKNEENVCSSSHEKNQLEHDELKKQVSELTIKLEDTQKLNKNLEVNLSSLLRTAKAELARKDRMIEELRKKIDSIDFRRGSYTKTTEYVARRSIKQRILVGSVYESSEICLQSDKTNFETMEVNIQDNLGGSKEHKPQKEINLVPVTVFGERLRKRLIREKMAEHATKQISLKEINTDGNSNESIEGSVTESDKENGSQTNTRTFDSKDSCPLPTVKDFAAETSQMRIVATTDLRSIDDHEIDMVLRQRSTLGVRHSSKRPNEDAIEDVSIKRLKSSKIDDTKIRNEHGLKEEEFRYKPKEHPETFTSYSHLSEKYHEYSTKSSIHSKRLTCDSSPDTTKQRCFLDVPSEKKEVKNSKEGNDRDRALSRLDPKPDSRSDDGTRFGSQEKYVDYRTSENSKNYKKDGRRTRDSSYDDYYRTSHREEHNRNLRKPVDYRYRKKSDSYARYRDERYERNKYDKYSSHRDKYEKCYDFRETAEDNTNTVIKESYETRNSAKQIACRKTETAESGNSRRNNDRYEDRRFRPTEKLNKQERKKIEQPEESDRDTNEEKSLGNSRPSSEKKNDDYEKPIEKKSHPPQQASSNSPVCTDREESSVHLEDGEIPASPVKNPETNDAVDDLSTIKENGDQEKCNVTDENDKFDKLKQCHDAIPLPSSAVPELPLTKKLIENPENNENVENVENIEKFIRDYGSSNTNSEEPSVLTDEENLMEKETEEVRPAETTIEIVKVLNETNSIVDFNASVKDVKTDPPKNSEGNDLNVVLDECGFDNNTSSKSPKQSIDATLEVSLNAANDQNLLDVEVEKIEIQTTHHEETNSSPRSDEKSVANETKEIVYEEKQVAITEETNKEKDLMKDKVEPVDQEPETTAALPSQLEEKTCDQLEKEEVCEKTDNLASNFEVDIAEEPSTKPDDNFKEEKQDLHNVEKETTKSPVKSPSKDKAIQEKPLDAVENLVTQKQTGSVKQTPAKVQGKIIVFARRRKPVRLVDTNASMTIVVNGSNTSHAADRNSPLKPRACKLPRRYKNT